MNNSGISNDDLEAKQAHVPSNREDLHHAPYRIVSNRSSQDSNRIRNTIDFVPFQPAPESSICLVFIKTTTDKVRESLDLAYRIARLQEFEHAHLPVDSVR